MHPYLRQAFMRYHNEYFSMSEEEQTRFKLQEHDKLDEKISRLIEKKIRKRGKLNNEQRFEFNKISLPYRGIGPNSFMLNEFDWNEKILDFKNLYKYNENFHNFQENACVEDFTGYEARPLFNRFNCWARAYVKDEFYYLNVLSYQMWLYYALDNASMFWLDKNIPHDYVSGPDDGKKTKGGYLLDMQLDAHGLEGYYDHMNKFSHKWINEFYDNLENDRWDNVFAVPCKDNGDPLDPAIDYIFGSMDILKEITFVNFIEDCEKVHTSNEELLLTKTRALELYEIEMVAEFVRIQDTPSKEFERDKSEDMQVVMAPEALESMIDMDDDE